MRYAGDGEGGAARRCVAAGQYPHPPAARRAAPVAKQSAQSAKLSIWCGARACLDRQFSDSADACIDSQPPLAIVLPLLLTPTNSSDCYTTLLEQRPGKQARRWFAITSRYISVDNRHKSEQFRLQKLVTRVTYTRNQLLCARYLHERACSTPLRACQPVVFTRGDTGSARQSFFSDSQPIPFCPTCSSLTPSGDRIDQHCFQGCIQGLWQ